jgi:U3 small nucleolar RNA-associated protein 25
MMLDFDIDTEYHSDWTRLQTRSRAYVVAVVCCPTPSGFFLQPFEEHQLTPMDDGNSITTKLLTLLNVSATKIGKRKRVDDDFVPAEKLNKRKSVIIATESPTEKSSEQEDVTAEKEVLDDEGGIPGKNEEEAVNDDGDDGVSHRKRLITLLKPFFTLDTIDAYERHFGTSSSVLSESSRGFIEQNIWKTSREKLGKLGPAVISLPPTADAPAVTTGNDVSI